MVERVEGWREWRGNWYACVACICIVCVCVVCVERVEGQKSCVYVCVCVCWWMCGVCVCGVCGGSGMSHINGLSHTCDWIMSHMNASCHTYECVKSHKWMSHVTNMNESCHTYESRTCPAMYVMDSISRLLKIICLLQKSPIKEHIICKRDL